MSIESRITGGDISLLVKPSLVDRVGFCVIEGIHQSSLHPTDFEVVLVTEDEIFNIHLSYPISNNKLKLLALALKSNELYLANTQIRPILGKYNIPESALGSADLYKERKEPRFEGVTESDGIRH